MVSAWNCTLPCAPQPAIVAMRAFGRQGTGRDRSRRAGAQERDVAVPHHRERQPLRPLARTTMPWMLGTTERARFWKKPPLALIAV